jgi:hypothetical protein
MIERETATAQMMESLFTEKIKQAIRDAIMPSIAKFNKEHPLLVASYDFTVQIDDGLRTIKGGSKSDSRAAIRLLRKFADQEIQQKIAAASAIK